MEIKEYDLVKYQNGIYRVMSIVNPTTVKIATYGQPTDQYISIH